MVFSWFFQLFMKKPGFWFFQEKTEKTTNPATQHGYSFPCYYTEDGTLIQYVSSVLDVGVDMESCAAFNKEVSLAIKKVSQIAGWVLRVFRNKDKIVLLTLFKTMVLPHLEYCCQLCSPVQTGQIQKLESVPRSFTAKVNGLQAKTYWERLKTFNIYSLLR